MTPEKRINKIVEVLGECACFDCKERAKSEILKLVENKKEGNICEHINTIAHRKHVICNDCHMIKTDSGDDWGSAKNKWFKTIEQAHRNRG